MNIAHSETKRRKPRVSKKDWLNTALDVLREGGIEAVRVERLAARLEVSKSGFYYHFGDLGKLKDALLDHWESIDSMPQARKRKMADLTAAELLKDTVKIVSNQHLGELDSSIRQWASTDPKVRKVYEREVNSRFKHVRSIFASHGFEGDDLEMRTMTFVAYTTTEARMFKKMGAKKRARLWNMRLAMLLSDP